MIWVENHQTVQGYGVLVPQPSYQPIKHNLTKPKVYLAVVAGDHGVRVALPTLVLLPSGMEVSSVFTFPLPRATISYGCLAVPLFVVLQQPGWAGGLTAEAAILAPVISCRDLPVRTALGFRRSDGYRVSGHRVILCPDRHSVSPGPLLLWPRPRHAVSFPLRVLFFRTGRGRGWVFHFVGVSGQEMLLQLHRGAAHVREVTELAAEVLGIALAVRRLPSNTYEDAR